MHVQKSRKGNYGMDAPGVVRNLTLMGIGFLILGIAALSVRGPLQPAGQVVGTILLAGFLIGIVETLYMVWSSKVGKFRACERLLDLVYLRGDERVLDVGCGRGLVLIAAAQRLTTGKAVGVDIWNPADQSGNCPEATWANARAEGVADRVEVVDGDVRHLPFADHEFDAVVSSLVLHNIRHREERAKALGEILRVLKPGGRFAMLDFQHAQEYAAGFRQLGAVDVRVSGLHYLMFPPVRIVTGRKP
jgi:SAM-dependent methyltransferase